MLPTGWYHIYSFNTLMMRVCWNTSNWQLIPLIVKGFAMAVFNDIINVIRGFCLHGYWHMLVCFKGPEDMKHWCLNYRTLHCEWSLQLDGSMVEHILRIYSGPLLTYVCVLLSHFRFVWMHNCLFRGSWFTYCSFFNELQFF